MGASSCCTWSCSGLFQMAGGERISQQKPEAIILSSLQTKRFLWSSHGHPSLLSLVLPGCGWVCLCFPRPDFLTFFCAVVCGNKILFCLLWKNNTSAVAAKRSCRPTRKKARGKALCQFVSLFVQFYCVIVLVYSLGCTIGHLDAL